MQVLLRGCVPSCWWVNGVGCCWAGCVLLDLCEGMMHGLFLMLAEFKVVDVLSCGWGLEWIHFFQRFLGLGLDGFLRILVQVAQYFYVPLSICCKDDGWTLVHQVPFVLRCCSERRSLRGQHSCTAVSFSHGGLTVRWSCFLIIIHNWCYSLTRILRWILVNSASEALMFLIESHGNIYQLALLFLKLLVL